MDLCQGQVAVFVAVARETEHLAVDKDRLTKLGFVPGEWLAELKLAVRRCLPETTEIRAPTVDGGERTVTSGELAADVLTRTPGQRLAYLTDLAHTEDNLRRAVELARDVDLLICEAAFLHVDAELAAERRHLTARQAGELARAAGAKKLAPFHFSPRYTDREHELIDEAAAAFGGPVVQLPGS